MFSSWLKVWRRSLRRYGMYTIINVTGLSLGICAVVSILVYVLDELSYDRFHALGDRVYRVNTISRFGDAENRYATTSAPLADAIRADLPAVEEAARLFERQATLQVQSPAGEKFREDHVYFADPQIFWILSFEFLAGRGPGALANPNQVVISERLALRYFGSIDAATGQELLFEGRVPLTVSAVFRNFPSQSHLEIDAIAHFENFFSGEREEIANYLRQDWMYNPISTYVLLREGTDPVDATSEINKVKDAHADERVIKGVTYELQPVRDIHLYSVFTFSGAAPGIRSILILSSIGLLVLIIACVNFINLSNVHSLKRAREIGIRKVMGAGKGSLVSQFLSESGGLVLVSFSIALLLLFILLPLINDVTGKAFQVADFINLKIVGSLALLFVSTAFLAGIYPSFYITRFDPVKVLKGISGHRLSEGFLVRRSLIIGQLTISICLVVMAIVFYQQMEFVRNKPLGFDQQGIVALPLFSATSTSILGGGVDGPLRQRMNSFESELLRESAIEAVTASSGLPGGGAVSALVTTQKIKAEDNVFVAVISVDYDFLETYKVEVIRGRNFSKEFGTDHLQAFIINAQAVKQLGWTSPEAAIGEKLGLLGKDGTVVGVVRDFHFQGLQQPLRPLILEVAASKFTVFSIRLQHEVSVAASLESIKSQWDKAFPEMVFEYHFLDDRLALNYESEQRMVRMMETFSALAIMISALGLFGLSAYVNHQRGREVSIRKILGASTEQVFATLSKEFVLMVGIAMLISLPVAVFLALQWLGTFAYKVEVGILPFVGGGLIAIATVAATISWETVRAARANPVDKLRAD